MFVASLGSKFYPVAELFSDRPLFGIMYWPELIGMYDLPSWAGGCDPDKIEFLFMVDL